MAYFYSQTHRERIVVVIAIIAGVGIFYFSTIREMDGWADFTQYVHHAKNIATGTAYAETGYIYNPFYATLGPPVYPPVFPALLSFVYRLFPNNLTALRIEMISIFLITLWVLFLNFQHILPWKYLIAALLCIGFNPLYWEYKDKIVSDIPFVFFTYLALLVIHRCYAMKEKIKWWNSLLTGFLLYLAYGTRSLGLVLVASLVIYDLLRNRKLTAFAVSATLVFLFFAGLQTIYLPGVDYKERLNHISAFNTVSNLLIYAKYGSYFWDNGYSKIALHFVSAAVFCLAAIGFVSRIRIHLSIYEIFALVFATVLVLYPGHHHRYLFALIPLCIVYAFLGIHKLTTQRRFAKNENVAYVMLAVLIFASYVGKYTTVQYSARPEGVHKEESVELFRYLKQNTSEDDVMIFRRPRALAFYTGRKVSVYHRTEPREDKDLWDYFRHIHASYIIEGYFDEQYFRQFVVRYRNNLQKVYSNTDFTVYRISAYPEF